MDPKAPIILIVSLVAVLLVILALQETMAGEWTTIAQNVTLAIVCIGLIGLIMLIINRR